MHTFWKKSISVFLFAMLLLQLSLPTFALTKETGSSVPGTEFVSSTATTASTSSVAAPQKHEPVPGVVDGAVYYLRNAANGTYMDVDNCVTTSGTNISTFQFNGGPWQQFKFRYLGKGTYELIPMHSQSTYVRAVDSSSGTNIAIDSSRYATGTQFKVTPVGDGKYTLCSSSHDFTDAVGFDIYHPNNVIQQNYDSYTIKEYAQWYLECVDETVYDSYEKFYLRNVNTGLYLDVIENYTYNNAIVHARPLVGGECTQFRQVYDAATNSVTIVPMHYTRSKMALTTQNLVITNGTSSAANARFRMEAAGTDEFGRTAYRIRSGLSGYAQYLNMGDLMGTDPDFRYLKNGSDASDLWVLEPVRYDAPVVYCLTINADMMTGVDGNDCKLALTYQARSSSRYKLEITTRLLSPISFAIYDNMTGEEPVYCVARDEQALYSQYDLFFEEGHTYFIEVTGVGEAHSSFAVKLRQFAAAFHSNNQSNLQADEGTAALLYTTAAMNWYVTRRPGITANEARQANHELTGYSDFNSEIFLYSGHGNASILGYEGNQSTLFRSQDLPLMPYCELAVFASCYSASTSASGAYSMVEQSIRNGARTAIGWSDSIGDASSNLYLKNFMYALACGYGVEAASREAISISNFSSANAIVSSLEIGGSKTNVLFPRSALLTASASTDATPGNSEMQNAIFAADEYTLVADNKNCGIRLYTRMINGIPSDDFYLEFYDENGNITGMKKSENTMDIRTANRLSAATAEALVKKSAEEQATLVYTCTNGVWKLAVQK